MISCFPFSIQMVFPFVVVNLVASEFGLVGVMSVAVQLSADFHAVSSRAIRATFAALSVNHEAVRDVFDVAAAYFFLVF